MRETPRITRDWTTGIPRWRTSYAQPFNWFLVPPLAVLPIALWLLFVPASSPLSGPLFFACFAFYGILYFFKRRRNHRLCARYGHVPWQPIPELRAWECVRCGDTLDLPENDVSEAVLDAAAQIGEARLGKDVPQARWSNRR